MSVNSRHINLYPSNGMDFFMPKNMRGRDHMYFFSGRLGVYERMMTEKPGFNRRAGKSGKDGSQKKPRPKKEEQPQKIKKSEEQENG